MTPNNIAGMASIKGLDAIAVCDHNAARNLPALEITCERHDIVLLPGLECTTAEEVHLLTYFPDVAKALSFEESITPFRTRIPNRVDFWGEQQILNENDDVVGTEPDWLVPALSLTLDELVERCEDLGGLAVPAHINRGENGLLTVLGFLPPGSRFAAIELSAGVPEPPLDLSPYKRLYSSDAHRLNDISERVFCIETEERSRAALWQSFIQWRARTT